MTMKTSVKAVYDVVKNKILSCEYKPGQLVSEKEIVEELNTSRTPVREALNILNGQGLLKIIPKKGLQISSLSMKRIKEIYDVRMLLEPVAVRQAMKYIKPDDVEYLIELDNKLSDDYDKENVPGVFKTGMDIHLYIAHLSGNETIFTLIKLLRDESYRGYVYYLKRYLDGCTNEDRKATEKSLSNIHSRFIKALIEGDEEAAVNYVIEDLSTMKKLITES